MGEEPWAVRRPRLVNELQFNTTDHPEAFICLQEVLHEQLLDILSFLNSSEKVWDYIGVGRDDGKQEGEYSPILYRPSTWKLQTSLSVWLSETPDRPSKSWDAASIRILTIGGFQHGQTKKAVIGMNTHLDDQGSRSRLEAAKIITDQIDKISSEVGCASIPLFLAGDFNSETHMEAYLYLKDHSPMIDVQTLKPADERYGHHDTFTGFGHETLPLTRIDFLFIKCDINHGSPDENTQWVVKNYAVLENRFEDGVYSSDHRAVVADLQLN